MIRIAAVGDVHLGEDARGTLRPALDLLLEQPGADDARRFIAVARTLVGDWTTAYLPTGGTIHLYLDAAMDCSARWFDPGNGHWLAAEPATAIAERLSFTAPSDDDWVLDLRRP